MKLILCAVAALMLLSACSTGPGNGCGQGFYFDQGTGRCIPSGDSAKR